MFYFFFFVFYVFVFYVLCFLPPVIPIINLPKRYRLPNVNEFFAFVALPVSRPFLTAANVICISWRHT